MAGPFPSDDTVVTRGETDAHGTLRTVAHTSGPFLCRRPCRGLVNGVAALLIAASVTVETLYGNC